MGWANLGRKAFPFLDDAAAAAYLARLRRPLRAAAQPDMSLGSPMFDAMYKADKAYEQVARNRTPNLRHSGGELASIAGQAIRAENAAARQAQAGSALDRALRMDPDGLHRIALPALGAGLTVAGGGAVIRDAVEERRKRQAEQEAAARKAMISRYAQEVADASQQAADGQFALDMVPPSYSVDYDPVATPIVGKDEPALAYTDDVEDPGVGDMEMALMDALANQAEGEYIDSFALTDAAVPADLRRMRRGLEQWEGRRGDSGLRQVLRRQNAQDEEVAGGMLDDMRSQLDAEAEKQALQPLAPYLPPPKMHPWAGDAGPPVPHGAALPTRPLVPPARPLRTANQFPSRETGYWTKQP